MHFLTRRRSQSARLYSGAHAAARVHRLGGAAATWPLAAHAQQPERVRRIGVLLSATADDVEYQAWVGAFLQALYTTAAEQVQKF